MQLQSPQLRECNETALMPAQFMAAALFLSAVGAGLGGGPTYAAAQEASTDVAYVQEVSGRVVAFSQGKPTFVDALDVISDRTRLDLMANSELRICHYQTRRLVTLTGPFRASISRDGVTAENGKVVLSSAGSCAPPVVSSFQGGLVARGTGLKTLNVPLQPSIKVVNRGTVPIRTIALWDGEHQTMLTAFERTVARPMLNDGQSYLLVVERSDGSEFKMMLRGDAVTQTDPLIVVVR